MLGKERIFDTGIDESTWEKYSVLTDAGREIRAETAQKIRNAIHKLDYEFLVRDEQVRRIEDSIQRYMAAQRLHTEYLFTMGVQYRDRQFLREIVEETIRKGHLTPRQIEMLAKDRGALQDYL